MPLLTNETGGRVGYNQLMSGKFEKSNCFSKFSYSGIVVGFFKQLAFSTFY